MIDPRRNGERPAHPVQGSQFHGLTKRELIAAMMLQSLLVPGNHAADDEMGNEQVALEALALADALLVELAQE